MAGRTQHSALRESDNYFWNENTEVLGRGSFSTVHKCYKKGDRGNIYDVDANSTVYAVKVCCHGTEFSERETETWGKASGHDNIVKLLSIEKELLQNVDVIVMEYCNGGSLQDYLDLPEHSYGLPDSDLLAVLHDLTAGMWHLHELKISHRDIKPLNVMCCFTQPGVATFKLGDFGFARSLDSSSEIFHSTPCTGPYADPDILMAGVHRTRGTFKSTIDLWSLAVTLYQCVTGRLPFICTSALGNRDDHNAALISMHASRPERAISGILNAGDSKPEWRNTYPADCLISSALADHLLPLQKGLFNKEVTFESFFEKVRGLVRCRRLQAVDVFGARLHHLYISSGFRIDDVRGAAQSAIGADFTCDMLLLHSDGSPLTDENIDKVLTEPLTASHRGRIMDSRVKPLFVIRNRAWIQDSGIGSYPISFALGEGIHDLVEVTILKAKIRQLRDRDAARLRAFRMKIAVERAKTTYDCLKRGMMLVAAKNAAQRSNITEGIWTSVERGKKTYKEVIQDLSLQERTLLLQAPSGNEAFIQHCELGDDLTRHLGDIHYLLIQMKTMLRSPGRIFEESYSRVEEIYKACRTCLENLHIPFQKWIKNEPSPCSATESTAQPRSDPPRKLHKVVAELDSDSCYIFGDPAVHFSSFRFTGSGIGDFETHSSLEPKADSMDRMKQRRGDYIGGEGEGISKSMQPPYGSFIGSGIGDSATGGPGSGCSIDGPEMIAIDPKATTKKCVNSSGVGSPLDTNRPNANESHKAAESSPTVLDITSTNQLESGSFEMPRLASVNELPPCCNSLWVIGNSDFVKAWSEEESLALDCAGLPRPTKTSLFRQRVVNLVTDKIVLNYFANGQICKVLLPLFSRPRMFFILTCDISKGLECLKRRVHKWTSLALGVSPDMHLVVVGIHDDGLKSVVGDFRREITAEAKRHAGSKSLVTVTTMRRDLLHSGQGIADLCRGSLHLLTRHSVSLTSQGHSFISYILSKPKCELFLTLHTAESLFDAFFHGEQPADAFDAILTHLVNTSTVLVARETGNHSGKIEHICFLVYDFIDFWSKLCFIPAEQVGLEKPAEDKLKSGLITITMLQQIIGKKYSHLEVLKGPVAQLRLIYSGNFGDELMIVPSRLSEKEPSCDHEERLREYPPCVFISIDFGALGPPLDSFLHTTMPSLLQHLQRKHCSWRCWNTGVCYWLDMSHVSYKYVNGKLGIEAFAEDGSRINELWTEVYFLQDFVTVHAKNMRAEDLLSFRVACPYWTYRRRPQEPFHCPDSPTTHLCPTSMQPTSNYHCYECGKKFPRWFLCHPRKTHPDATDQDIKKDGQAVVRFLKTLGDDSRCRKDSKLNRGSAELKSGLRSSYTDIVLRLDKNDVVATAVSNIVSVI